jgi:hypothetical protein
MNSRPATWGWRYPRSFPLADYTGGGVGDDVFGFVVQRICSRKREVEPEERSRLLEGSRIVLCFSASIARSECQIISEPRMHGGAHGTWVAKIDRLVDPAHEIRGHGRNRLVL